MKPDKKTCLYCGKEITGKKKYCDDAHRMAYKRQPEQTTKPNTNKAEQKPPEHETEQPRFSADIPSLTKTDKTFYERAMRDFGEPYYKFNKLDKREEKCLQCGAKFTTTLQLLKYCSYDHYKTALGK